MIFVVVVVVIVIVQLHLLLDIVVIEKIVHHKGYSTNLHTLLHYKTYHNHFRQLYQHYCYLLVKMILDQIDLDEMITYEYY